MTQRGDTSCAPRQTIESGPSVKELLLLCRHSDSAPGDRALNLLLEYLENREPSSYGHLLEALSSLRPRIHRLPPILWRILCDWMAFTYLPGKEGKGQDAARDLLRSPPEPLFPCLLHRPISLGPWTDILPPRFFCTEPGRRGGVEGAVEAPETPGSSLQMPAWGEPTFRDLAPLWKKRPSRRARPISRAGGFVSHDLCSWFRRTKGQSYRFPRASRNRTGGDTISRQGCFWTTSFGVRPRSSLPYGNWPKPV